VSPYAQQKSPRRLVGGAVLVMLLCIVPEVLAEETRTESRKNVMLIMVDDLRPQFKAYAKAYGLNGAELAKTPALDLLASESFLFERAHCSVPVCGASRLSILTGTRPYKEPGKPWGRQWMYSSCLRKANQDEPAGINYSGTTMPRHFKDNGYKMYSIGKVYHNWGDDEEVWDDFVREQEPWMGVPAYEIGTGERNQDEAYVDGRNASDVVEKLEELKDEAFFYAVGFPRPHLPFVAPRKYWDLYPVERVELPDNYYKPAHAPRESLHNWPELRNYSDLVFADETETRLDDDYARTLIRGYSASMSYVDAQIARVVHALKTTYDSEGTRLYDKTIIVVWGDHGYNLGEHGSWTKHVLYGTALQVPLMIRDPDVAKGQSVSALVESVDLYPTLCDLAAIGSPSSDGTPDGGTFAMEGTSLVPLMNNPARPWKTAVFARYRMGDTVRTDRFAYTEYVNAEDEVVSCMLYDLKLDPHENHNIAGENPDLVNALSGLLGGRTAEGKRYAWRKVVRVEGANAPITTPLELPSPKYPDDYLKLVAGHPSVSGS